MTNTPTNAAAKAFKALHVPAQPLLLANVHDATSARVVAALPGCKALATASFSIALANGTEDDALTLETQLSAVRDIAAVARAAGKPLTVDLQSGYGPRLEEAVTKMIELGAVGINLEDSTSSAPGSIMDEAEAVDRVRRALRAAADAGVPDFVVNARSDTFLRGGPLNECIRRARLFLDAGATTVYILGPVGRAEVETAVEALNGMVNVGLNVTSPGPGVLSAADFAQLGVARISIGPQLYQAAMAAMKKTAEDVFKVA